LGASTAIAVSDRSGRFELRTLSPGPYLVWAHLVGFVASRGQVVDVRPSGRASSSIALRRANTGTTASSSPILEAGTGAAPETPAPATETVGAGGTPDAAGNDDHGEIAWRLRHARRAGLKDATPPAGSLAAGAGGGERAHRPARAGLPRGDIASWIVAGEYTTRAPARHRYDIGLSYSKQRYEGGNFAALRYATDGSRNAGALYGFDTFSI